MEQIKSNCMESFIISSNAYGMVLMIGIFFCFFNYSVSKKWYNFLIAIFLFVNLLFSFCRASIAITILVSIIYIVYIVCHSIQKNKTIKIVLLSSIATIVLFVSTLVALSIFTKGKVLHAFYELFDFSSISAREVIWFNTYQLLYRNPIKTIFIGNGFGLINVLLLQMNLNSWFDSTLMFPTHNSYLTLFGEGGLLYLLAYLTLLIYITYISIKCYKKQAPIAITLAFGTLVFSFYSLIETIHYLVYPFMFLMMVFYNVCYPKQNKQIK